ncbi:MAG TPA: hypothetical protein V6D06_06040 [Trichocoleus sp.]
MTATRSENNRSAATQPANALQKFLKASALISSLALSTVALTGQAALAGKQNFEVQNDSSQDVIEIYMTASHIDDWGQDLLGQYSILRSGYSMQVEFEDPTPATCLYDILTVFESGEVLEDYGVNVCRNDYYTVFDN